MAKRQGKAEAISVARSSMIFRMADYLAEVDPKALGTLGVYVLTKLQQVDVRTYNCLGAQVARNTLNECGVPDAMDQLKQKLTAGDTDGAAEVAEWLGGLVVGIDCLASGVEIKAPVEPQQPAVRKTGGKGFVM